MPAPLGATLRAAMRALAGRRSGLSRRSPSTSRSASACSKPRQAGCALVLSDIPAFRELWSGAALFVPPHDDAAIADALDSVLWDDALRDRMARTARERSTRYTVERMAVGMAAHYGRLLGRELAGAYARSGRSARQAQDRRPQPDRRRWDRGMKVAYSTHSLASCWNHGNAHFLRGVLRELVHAGHEVEVFEPEIPGAART